MTEEDNALAIAKLEGDRRGEIRVLEERMETKQAKYRTDIARLAEQSSQQETRLLLSIAVMITLGVSVMILTVTLIALWPPS